MSTIQAGRIGPSRPFGVPHGASVSSSRRSAGTRLATSRRSARLALVTTPENEMKKPRSRKRRAQFQSSTQ